MIVSAGGFMGEVHGFCDERFEPLEVLFRANQESGLDEGASLAVTLQGEMVVDLWGGYRDQARTEPWEENTMTFVFSTSKIMVIIAVLMMYDRGLLDLDAPIADYWPEFAQNGKGAVTTRQLFVHQTGLPGFGRQISFDELHDWDHVIEIIEQAELWFEPGSMSCYHVHTYGFMLGELVRRCSGMPFEDFFRSEIAVPLGADFHFGLTSPLDQERVSELWYPGPSDLGDGMGARAFDEVEQRPWVIPDRMAAVIPASNGIGNGRSMARIGAMMAMGGEVDGRRYLSRGTVEEASSEQSYFEDDLLGWLRIGLGFGLHSDEFPAPTPTTFHWGGFGGSFITMDTATGLSCGFAPNRLLVEEDDVLPALRLHDMWREIGDISRTLG